MLSWNDIEILIIIQSKKSIHSINKLDNHLKLDQ